MKNAPISEAAARDLHARHRLVGIVLVVAGCGWVDLGGL